MFGVNSQHCQQVNKPMLCKPMSALQKSLAPEHIQMTSEYDCHQTSIDALREHYAVADYRAYLMAGAPLLLYATEHLLSMRGA